MLEQQLAYHIKQTARCRRALDAYRGQGDAGSQVKGISWVAAIDEAFQESAQLTIDELRAKLVKKGLPAHDAQSLNTIRATLSRKTSGKGTLERVSAGVYRRKLLISDETKSE